MAPVAESKLKRQGLRSPWAKISGCAPRQVDEGVIERDPVGPRCGDVQAEDGAEERCQVLAVAQGVAAAAAVAEGEVEHAVRPEGQLPAVVVGEGLRHLQQDLLRCRIHCFADYREAGEHRPSRPGGGVVQIEPAIAGVRGRKRQSQEPLFPSGVDAVADIGEERGFIAAAGVPAPQVAFAGDQGDLPVAVWKRLEAQYEAQAV